MLLKKDLSDKALLRNYFKIIQKNVRRKYSDIFFLREIFIRSEKFEKSKLISKLLFVLNKTNKSSILIQTIDCVSRKHLNYQFLLSLFNARHNKNGWKIKKVRETALRMLSRVSQKNYVLLLKYFLDWRRILKREILSRASAELLNYIDVVNRKKNFQKIQKKIGAIVEKFESDSLKRVLSSLYLWRNKTNKAKLEKSATLIQNFLKKNSRKVSKIQKIFQTLYIKYIIKGISSISNIIY
jgi:hypothetical protein